MKKIVIAIDGFSSSGKSTMAKDLAREIGYIYIDTGAMYRAVTLYSLKQGYFSAESINEKALEEDMPNVKISFQLNKSTGKPETYLNGVNVEGEIRGMEVSSRVSKVAALSFVRRAMVRLQQEMGQEKGIVMDGRDIGTVVFPDAELKIFVTAPAELRAKRRQEDLQAQGQSVSYEEILENIKQRDYLDTHREESPLQQAPDALLLDNTQMTLQEQKEWLLEQVRRVTEK